MDEYFAPKVGAIKIFQNLSPRLGYVFAFRQDYNSIKKVK
jgi:hypothetical protein